EADVPVLPVPGTRSQGLTLLQRPADRRGRNQVRLMAGMAATATARRCADDAGRGRRRRRRAVAVVRRDGGAHPVVRIRGRQRVLLVVPDLAATLARLVAAM